MAEPVEDDVSFLGFEEVKQRSSSPRQDHQVSSREIYSVAADYPASEYQPAGALRAPVIPSPLKHDRKNSLSSRTSPAGSGTDKNSPYSSSSPVASPRPSDRSPNYNIDASGSTYALQVALRNMKERYHKLQKKMALIEDDNSRLIGGKTELFGEIGKLQENSIKLREKNLQLNQEIHTKHTECCSLKEKYSSLSTENMNLTRQLAKSIQENRRLTKQVNLSNDENRRLKDKLMLISTQLKALPGGASLVASATEFSSPSKTKIVPLSEELDSFSDPPSRFLSSHKSTLDEYEQVSSSELSNLEGTWEDIGGDDKEMLTLIQAATQRMRTLLVNLQDQNHSLLLQSINTPSGGSESRLDQITLSRDGMLSQDETPNQRDRDLSTLTLTPSSQAIENNTEETEDGVCQSRLATCGSVINSAFISSGALNTSQLTDDSAGDNNVHVEANINLEDNTQTPFDWRQVQVSDDEGREHDGGRPDMRTVSTSPVPGLLDEEEDRICPMCNACFPRVIPQESFESHVVSHFEVENGFEVIA